MGKKTPSINSSSTADIAFLLLCYFLMTTTMGSQTGLSRRLPQMPDPNQKQEDIKINKRNIVIVKINSADRILAGNEPIDISQLKDKIKEFLSNPAEDPNLPEKASSLSRMTVVPATVPISQFRTSSLRPSMNSVTISLTGLMENRS